MACPVRVPRYASPLDVAAELIEAPPERLLEECEPREIYELAKRAHIALLAGAETLEPTTPVDALRRLMRREEWDEAAEAVIEEILRLRRRSREELEKLAEELRREYMEKKKMGYEEPELANILERYMSVVAALVRKAAAQRRLRERENLWA